MQPIECVVAPAVPVSDRKRVATLQAFAAKFLLEGAHPGEVVQVRRKPTIPDIFALDLVVVIQIPEDPTEEQLVVVRTRCAELEEFCRVNYPDFIPPSSVADADTTPTQRVDVL